MAATILAPHPLSTLSSDCEVALILECEDPMLMSEERLAGLLQASRPGDTVEPEVWGYLHGLLDQRRYGKPA
jgi:hypothetical protein